MAEDERVVDPQTVKAAFADAQRLIDLVTSAFLDGSEEEAEKAEEKIQKLSEEALSATMAVAETLGQAVMLEWIRREGE